MMDKRKTVNQEIKRKITDALFLLLKEKPLHEITVTELVKKAGVARISFYRNYSSKEDVLQTLVNDVLASFAKEARGGAADFYCYENVLLSFRYFLSWRNYFVDMYRSNFAALLLESLNQFHEELLGEMPAASIERYQLYIYIGALFDTATVWLQNNARESPEEMAAMFCRCAKLPVPEDYMNCP